MYIFRGCLVYSKHDIMAFQRLELDKIFLNRPVAPVTDDRIHRLTESILSDSIVNRKQSNIFRLSGNITVNKGFIMIITWLIFPGIKQLVRASLGWRHY